MSTIVNRHAEFRMCLDQGAAAVWDVVHPSFTIFRPDSETFASVWAEYDSDFVAFHDRAVSIMDEHQSMPGTAMFPQHDQPPNTFDVSSLPWRPFTGFTLDIANGARHLAPIFTIGGYSSSEGQVRMPLAVQINHAAADGFHVARLIGELEELLADPSWVY